MPLPMVHMKPQQGILQSWSKDHGMDVAFTIAMAEAQGMVIYRNQKFPKVGDRARTKAVAGTTEVARIHGENRG